MNYSGLILCYSVSPDLGESWDRWCFMQLAAFIVLVAGTFLYVTSRAPPTPDEATAETEKLNSVVSSSSA